MVGHMYGSRVRAPATPLVCQKWLSAKYCDYTSPNVWRANSPDLNRMDYYAWGAVEKDANRYVSTTKHS